MSFLSAKLKIAHMILIAGLLVFAGVISMGQQKPEDTMLFKNADVGYPQFENNPVSEA